MIRWKNKNMSPDKQAARVANDRPGRSSFLRRLSLKHKLIAIVMLTCVSSLVLVGVVFGAWEWTALRHTMIQDLSAHAEIVADNCKAAVTFRDTADAGAVLRTVGAVSSIQVAGVYTSDGDLFAVYAREGTATAQSRLDHPQDGCKFRRGSLVLQKAIVLDGQRIGTVYLQARLDPLYQRLQRSIILIACVLAFSSLAAYLISARLQRIISSPILHLADVARLVSEKKEYTVRAAETGGDEVGLLIRAFNGMLGQIQQRDQALVDANEQLEARVSERTAELTATNERLTGEIAARRKTEQALAEANEQLADTVQNLRRSNKELQDFAHITAHDLKAPLRGVGTLADWLASDYADKFDEQGRQQLRLLKGRVMRLTELINSILHYSEIGRVAQRREVVDLGALVAETISRLSPPAHIQVEVRGSLPVVVGERIRLGQVFHHLLDNAIKYMNKPQGRVAIQCTDVGNAWRFTVSDNGPGIEEKYFEKIFQVFQTLAPRDQRESIGIGLAVVRKIVELFGGKVWVESTPGEGATFFFMLPKETTPAAQEMLVSKETSLN